VVIANPEDLAAVARPLLPLLGIALGLPLPFLIIVEGGENGFAR
jgi:hypothetical protein